MDVGSGKREDILPMITHAKQRIAVPSVGRHRLNQFELGVSNVLELIDENVLKSMRQFLPPL